MKELICIKAFTNIPRDFKMPPPEVGKTYVSFGPSPEKGHIYLKGYGKDWGFDETRFVPKNPPLKELLLGSVEEKLDIKKEEVCVG